VESLVRLRRRSPLRFPALKQGDSGPAIKKTQVLLNRGTGTQLTVDGIFGPRTREAVIAYQRSARLSPDGIVGIRTLSSLGLLNERAGGSGTPRGNIPRLVTSPLVLPPASVAANRALPFPSRRFSDIHEWPTKQIIVEILRRTGSHLPNELGAQWYQLISPSSLEMIAASMAVVVLAHIVGIGEIADLAMLGIGILFLGATAYEGGRELGAFMVTVASASTEEDLDRAAEDLARAVILLGVSAVMARFMMRASAGSGAAAEAAEAPVSPGGTAPEAGIRAAEREARNRASFEAYKDALRAEMERPAAQDAKLNSLLDELYRPGAKVGSGSTAAAVREELATGKPVGGRSHSQKARDYAIALRRWLADNPLAIVPLQKTCSRIWKTLSLETEYVYLKILQEPCRAERANAESVPNFGDGVEAGLTAQHDRNGNCSACSRSWRKDNFA
jgi:hypothetical protein